MKGHPLATSLLRRAWKLHRGLMFSSALCSWTTWKCCVQGLLDKDPRARLTAAEALEHCWFTGHSHNDAATLKHVHIRVAALASASCMPVRTPCPRHRLWKHTRHKKEDSSFSKPLLAWACTLFFACRHAAHANDWMVALESAHAAMCYKKTFPGQSMQQIPASLVPPSEESCATMPRPPNTPMNEPAEPTQKTS
jgi:hypothetical protein